MVGKITPGNKQGICWVSPSDKAGTPDNILSRLDALWQDIQRLDAINVQAGLVSSMTEALGVLHDFQFLAGEGWPGDFNYTGMSMSSTPLPISPEEQRVVAYMDNGRELFGYAGVGLMEGDFTTSGSAVFVSNSVNSPSYLNWVVYKDDPIAATLGSAIQLHEDGLYILNVRANASRAAATGSGDALFSIGLQGFASLETHMKVSCIWSAEVSAGTPIFGGASLIGEFHAGDLLFGHLQVQSGPAVSGSARLSITKLPS